MKVFILNTFVRGPYGGGNQFLKAIKKKWQLQNKYTNDPKEADFILFNSHESLKDVIKLKIKYPEKLFFHRIDGPMSSYRERNIYTDKRIYFIAEKLADGIIFQSQWSMKEAIKKFNYKSKKNDTVIHNSSDPEIFYKTKNKTKNKKIRLIASSWSTSIKKGFNIYSYLDKHLDFNKFDFLFIGNSPVNFKKIIIEKPKTSKHLAKSYQKSDIMIFASEIESCSNTIIEGLSCGLPIIYKSGSSNNEIVNKSGITFNSGKEAIQAIDYMIENYDKFCKKISVPSLDIISEKYFNFFKSFYRDNKIKKNQILVLIKIMVVFAVYTFIIKYIKK